MENNQPINIEIPNLETITRRRSLPIGLFGAAILFFFFNFCEMSCQGQRFAAISGVALATGTSIDSPQMDSPFGFGEPKQDTSKKMSGNVWAILAFLAAVTGLGLFLIRHRQADLVGAIAGGAGLISLVLLQVALTASVEKEGRGMIMLNFLFPYWASLLSLTGAGVLCLLRMMQQKQQPGAVPAQPFAMPSINIQFGAAPAATMPPAFAVAPPTVVPETPQPAPPAAAAEIPAPIVPPVVKPYASNPPAGQHAVPFPNETNQPALAQAPLQNTWNVPVRQGGQNWLIWLVAGAVTLIVIATLLLELKPGLISSLFAEAEAPATEKALPTTKSKEAKAVGTALSASTAAPETVIYVGYVHTLQGSDLRMREEPVETANVVLSIPNGSPVMVLAYDDHISTVNGERGKWYKIRFNGKAGWAWGKFITKTPK